MREYYGISSPNESFIAHYGVKGMRWGVRKAIKKAYKKLVGKKNALASIDKQQITTNKTAIINKSKNVYNNKLSKIEKKIDKFSENGNPGTWKGAEKFKHDGYMHADRFSPKSNRNQLFMKIMQEYSDTLNKCKDNWDGSPSSEKIWKDLNLKYKKDYLVAVLKDSKVPVNKQNMQVAHRIISNKDGEYSRYK